MATRLVKHTGSGTAPYDTWATAHATLAAAIAAASAGDIIWVSSTHSEAPSSLSITVPGTAANPTRIVCVTESGGSGNSGAATGALIDVTGTTFTVSGNFTCDGITFRSSAVGTAVPAFTSGNGNVQWYSNCRFEITSANTSAAFKFGNFSAGGGSHTLLSNCTFKFAHAGQRIQTDFNVRIEGGSIDGSGTAISGIFYTGISTRGGTLYVRNFDASAGVTTSAPIIATIGGGSIFSRLFRMKVPSSWTGAPVAAGQLKVGDRVEFIKGSSGATVYEAWVMDDAGTIRDESTVKVTAQTRSYKMVTSANCSPANPLRGLPVMAPMSGSAQTVTCAVATDNVTLTDADMHLEVDVLATAGSGLGTLITDRVASAVATPANQTTDSTTTWTTTGLTTPIKQSLACSATAGAVSDSVAVPIATKPSTTIYVAEEMVVA